MYNDTLLHIFYCTWFRFNSKPKNGKFANCRMRQCTKVKQCPLDKDDLVGTINKPMED